MDARREVRNVARSAQDTAPDTTPFLFFIIDILGAKDGWDVLVLKISR